MRCPPTLMHVKIQGEKRRFGLWLPLFLLLLLALVVLIIISPLILISVVVLWPSGWGKRILLVLMAALEVLCAMRRLRIDVQSSHQCIYISVV